jgi:hypothetical protein
VTVNNVFDNCNRRAVEKIVQKGVIPNQNAKCNQVACGKEDWTLTVYLRDGDEINVGVHFHNRLIKRVDGMNRILYYFEDFGIWG